MTRTEIHILDVNPTGFCAGRLITDGVAAEQTGEFLRKEYLVPALEKAMLNEDTVRISFRDPSPSARPKILTSGAYLQEAFGGLVTQEGFGKAFLEDRLEICFDGDLEDFLKKTNNHPWKFIQDAPETEKRAVSVAAPERIVSEVAELAAQ